ncbi:MAG: acyl carrier protein [Prevotella sp.]|uniref:acyl carrier protein n=1 Tax=Prevotella sp. AGR2160 TaxID=1280674 RepID=UPI000429B120|nr:acyl carrier protein [Prevotella sp. AGR2160]MDD5861707.1 acyl carrier protein [Prevotella sp.]
MTREEIIKKINSAMADEFEVEESDITPDANIKETLELDSLNLVDLVAMVQQEFKVQIPIADLPKIQTFKNLYDYIESHQG